MTAFPGDRRVWMASAVVLAVLAVVGLVALLVPRDYYTGTNSIRLRSYVAQLQPGQQLCIPDLQVPKGTGRVEVVSTRGAHPAVTATLSDGHRVLARGHLGAQADAADKIAVPIPRRTRTEIAAVCVRPSGGSVWLGGMAGLQSDMLHNSIDGAPFPNRVAVWFRPPVGDKASLLSRLPTTWEHASRFRPGWVGPWTYAALLLVVAPALVYAGLRILARSFAGERGRVAPALAVMLVALGNAATWATLTPTFNAPDEPDHFAYVQVLAETGKRPNPFATVNPPPHSTEETLGVDAVRLLSSVETPDGKPPWEARDEGRWSGRVADLGGRPRQDDGGGQTTAATHQPAYYALMAPAYLASAGGSIWTEAWVVRLWSALFGSLVALFAVLFVREVLPGRPAVAVTGGLLVAFLPQFAFISGAVNNDTGVNAAAALVLWLAARALRRGLTWRLGLALGAGLVVMPLFKQTGYALYPAVALALAGALWRRHDRAALAGVGALVAAFVVLRLGWDVTGGQVATVSPPPAAGAGPATTASSALSAARDHPTLVLSYFWQTFLPRLPFMTDLFFQRWPAFDIYVERGFAALGWGAYEFPRWVYLVVLAALAGLAGLAVRGLWERRHDLRTRWIEVAVVAVAVLGVLGGVAAVYAEPAPRPTFVQPEQGRYAFTVLAPMAAVAGLGVAAAGRRLAPVVAGAAVAGMAGLQVATLLLGLGGFFS